jgi:hypothetical protein
VPILQLSDQRVLARTHRAQGIMTTLTMRYVKGNFIVSGPDIEPLKFKTRREAKGWCMAYYPGSPIREIGADAAKRANRAMPRKGR